MNSIKQYRPCFIEGFPAETVDFQYLEELLAIFWVVKFKEYENFYRYSVYDEMLMAEYDRGSVWYVVGRLAQTDSIGLPTWVPQ